MWRVFFFFNDTATTEIYTLSLHDALPILDGRRSFVVCTLLDGKGETGKGKRVVVTPDGVDGDLGSGDVNRKARSEEHTSELQSQSNLVCRLLLEKKKTDETEDRPP